MNRLGTAITTLATVLSFGCGHHASIEAASVQSITILQRSTWSDRQGEYAWRATIHADGVAEFHGISFHDRLGRYEAEVYPEYITRLQELAADAIIAAQSAPTSPPPGEPYVVVSDGGQTITDIELGNRSERIEVKSFSPSELWAFEKALLHVVESMQWRPIEPLDAR